MGPDLDEVVRGKAGDFLPGHATDLRVVTILEIAPVTNHAKGLSLVGRA